MFFEQSAVAAVISAGAWNERGMIQELDRSGFTLNKCGAEFIANSCDAGASYTKFMVTADSIKLVDNGRGVETPADFVNMFEIARENHGSDKSMGVSGKGGSASGYMYSKNDNGIPSTELIYTRAKDGPYMKAIRDWNEISRTGCYTDKIKITQMTEDEIAEFDKDREHDGDKHGFTRKWEYSDSVAEVLDKQFDKDPRLLMNSNERWDLIFGHSQIDICLDRRSDGMPLKVLPKYEYFGGEDNKYYTGVNVETIHHYTDDKNENRFVWEDQTSGKNYEFKKNKKTTNKIISEVAIHPLWKHNGTIEIYNGMRKNPKIFDEQSPNPRVIDSAECFISSYEATHFHLESQKDKTREYIGETRLYRNGQAITGFRLEGYNFAAARGNANSMLKSFHHRSEIHYSTLSTQNNPTDNAFGIQSNKNQNQNVLPDSLERLICHLKQRNYQRITEHFAGVIEHAKETKRLAAEEKKQAAAALRQQLQAPVVLQIEEEEEEEEEEEDQFEDASDDDAGQKQDAKQEEPKQEQEQEAKQEEQKQELEKEEAKKQEPNQELEKEETKEQEQKQELEKEQPNQEEQRQVPVITKQLLIRLLEEKINENTDESKIMEIYNLLNNM